LTLTTAYADVYLIPDTQEMLLPQGLLAEEIHDNQEPQGVHWILKTKRFVITLPKKH
jgi:hypothetical protein